MPAAATSGCPASSSPRPAAPSPATTSATGSAGGAAGHEERLRAMGAPLTHRLATPIEFLAARLSPKSYLGLQLTIGVALIVLGGWLFGGMARDILHGDPLVEVDRAVATFLHARA